MREQAQQVLKKGTGWITEAWGNKGAADDMFVVLICDGDNFMGLYISS